MLIDLIKAETLPERSCRGFLNHSYSLQSDKEPEEIFDFIKHLAEQCEAQGSKIKQQKGKMIRFCLLVPFPFGSDSTLQPLMNNNNTSYAIDEFHVCYWI